MNMVLHTLHAVLGGLIVLSAPSASIFLERALADPLAMEMGAVVSPEKIGDAAKLCVVRELGPLLLNLVCCGFFLKPCCASLALSRPQATGNWSTTAVLLPCSQSTTNSTRDIVPCKGDMAAGAFRTVVILRSMNPRTNNKKYH